MSRLGGLPIYPIPEPGPDKVRLAAIVNAANEGVAAVADSLITAIAERVYAGDLELAEPQRFLRNKINNKLKSANRQLSTVSNGVATAIAERVAAGGTMLSRLPEGLPTGPPPPPGTIYQPPPPQPPVVVPPPIVQGPPIGPPTVPPQAWNLWKSSVSTPPPCYCLSSYSPPLHPGDTNVAQYPTFDECNAALGRFCDAMNVPRPPPRPPAAPIQTVPGQIPQMPPFQVPPQPGQIGIFQDTTIPFPQPTPQQQQIGGLIVGIPGTVSPPFGTPQGWIIVGYQDCSGNVPPIYGTGPGIVGSISGNVSLCAIWGPPTFNPDIITPTPQSQQPPFPIQNVPIGGPPTVYPIQNIPIGGPPTYPPTPCPPPQPCPPTPPCPTCPTRPTVADCQVCGKCENGKLSGIDTKVGIIPWGINVGSQASMASDCGQMELKEAVARNLNIAGILSALSQDKYREAMDKLNRNSGRASISDTDVYGEIPQGEIYIPAR